MESQNLANEENFLFFGKPRFSNQFCDICSLNSKINLHGTGVNPSILVQGMSKRSIGQLLHPISIKSTITGHRHCSFPLFPILEHRGVSIPDRELQWREKKKKEEGKKWSNKSVTRKCENATPTVERSVPFENLDFQISSRKISREIFISIRQRVSLAGERAEVAQIRKRIHRNIARCKRGTKSLLRMKRICTGAPVLFCQTPRDRTIEKRLRNRPITIFYRNFIERICVAEKLIFLPSSFSPRFQEKKNWSNLVITLV